MHFINRKLEQSVVSHGLRPRTQRKDTGESQEFEASLVYIIRPCLKKIILNLNCDLSVDMKSISVMT